LATSISHAQQRQVERGAERMCSLDRWQPDWVFVSHALQKLADVDLCRPSDVHPGQLKEAAIRKQDGYTPLVSALCHYMDKGWTVHICKYIDKGWTVHIFPWVFGTRGPHAYRLPPYLPGHPQQA
jgi:hypothetical protein